MAIGSELKYVYMSSALFLHYDILKWYLETLKPDVLRERFDKVSF